MEKKKLERIKTVVFDLDGTIYQDFTFHRHYFRRLLDGTGMEGREEGLVAFMDDVLSGKKLRMNVFYRPEPLGTLPPDEYFGALEALAADAPAPPAHAAESHGRGSGAPGDLIYLGDAWAVAMFLGKTLGLLEGARNDEVYYATRADMENSAEAGSPELRKALAKVGRLLNIALISNSPEDVAARYLKKLGFSGLFEHVGYSANKPEGFLKALEELFPNALSEPGTVMSVGDHAYNDLSPVQAIGGTAIWVCPYHGIHEPAYDAKLKSARDIAEFMQMILHYKGE